MKNIKQRSIKAIRRNNEIHDIDMTLRKQYGDAYRDMSRESIYKRIADKTGYCTKTIAWILNHTTKENISDF